MRVIVDLGKTEQEGMVVDEDRNTVTVELDSGGSVIVPKWKVWPTEEVKQSIESGLIHAARR